MQEVENTGTERRELEYERERWGEKYCAKIWMEISAYESDGNICVEFYSEDNNGMAPVIRATEDFSTPLKKNQAFLHDRMANKEDIAFLKKYGLGELTGEVGRCGIRTCPVFEFNEEVLKELDPEGYRRFEEIHNRENREPVKEMPDSVNTLDYHWELGEDKICLYVDSYAYGAGLAIQMYNREDENEDWDTFADLTVNLSGYCLDPGEAFISGDCSKDKLNFIKDYGLGKVIAKGHSGFAEYSLVKFNLKKLAEYDRVGVSKYCMENGIKLKEKRAKKPKEPKR